MTRLPGDYCPPIAEGVGEEKWTLYELSLIGSERINNLVGVIVALEDLRKEKGDGVRRLDEKVDSGKETLLPKEYEDLILQSRQVFQEVKDLELQRQRKLVELEDVVNMHHSKLKRCRDDKEEEQERSKLDNYLDSMRSIAVVAGSLISAREELAKRKSKFWDMLYRANERFGYKYVQENNPYEKEYGESLTVIWDGKIAELRSAIAELKKGKEWKQEFKDICGIKACDHLGLDIIDYDMLVNVYHHSASEGMYSFRCSLTGNDCVARNYLWSYQKEEKDIESRRQRCYESCAGYNVPKGLASKIKKVWDRRNR